MQASADLLKETIENASDDEIDRILAQLQMLEDFPTYSQHVLKVQTTKGKIQPFVLNGPQKILHKIIEEHIRPKRLIRIVALKARRMGFSTYFSGRFYQATSQQHNRYAIQITHEPEATDFLFKMVKRFYNLSSPTLRPDTLYNNSRLLEFNNNKGTGLNSAFRVATAGKDDVGSGQLIHYLHMSEVSKWPAHNTKDLLTSIMQCVPDDENTEVAYESTAKGIGGAFYDAFWGARYRFWVDRIENGEAVIEESINEGAREDDIYTSIFLPWFCFEQYTLKPQPGFVLTPEEEEIKKRHGLTDGQMCWRRWIISNKCNGDVNTFNQEYPDTPRNAFLGTGRPVFNSRVVADLMDASPPPIARYEMHAGNWIANSEGRLQVWEEPKAGASYIISADVSEGLRDGDFSCCDVIHHLTGKQVAQWHGRIDQDNVLELADILLSLGRRYNMALLAPERNNHGLGVVQQLYQRGYKNLYAEMVPDPPGRPRKRYGWLTSKATRPLIIDNLIKELTDGTHGIVAKGTFDEMLSFKIQDNGKMEADLGRFDDRVMSIAIAKYVRQCIPMPSFSRSYHEVQNSRGLQAPAPNPLGWT